MTRRLFGTLCGFVFFVNFARTVFAPLVGPFQATFGVGPAAVGLMTTLVWIGTAASRVPVGYLQTRFGRRLVVLASGVLLTAAAVLVATAQSLLLLQLGAFCVGLASGTYFVAAVPLVSVLFSDRVGRALGIHGTASQIAAVAAPLVAVAALDATGWRAIFWLLAGGVAVTTLVVVFATGGGVTSSSNVTPERDFGEVVGHWRLMLVGISFVAGVGFVWQGLFNFYVSYLSGRGFSTATAATMLTLMFTAGVPAFWISGRLADRFPHVPYLLAINAAFVVCVLALTVVDSRIALVAVTLILGFVVHSLFPAVDTFMLDSLPPGNRGATYAVYSGLSLLVEANGSGVVGVLRGVGFTFDTIFSVLAAGLGLLVLCLYGLYFSDIIKSSKTDVAGNGGEG